MSTPSLIAPPAEQAQTTSAGQDLRRSLTLRDGIPLAVGSIAGPGILFLPSLTYALSGHSVLVVWMGATLLCLPMLFMFTAMVRLVPDGSGVEGFVARGLGRHAAATVPVLFLALVAMGMPAGTLVAATFLRDAVGGGVPVQLGVALCILIGALIANLVGAGRGARVQRLVSWILLVMVIALCAAAYPRAHVHYSAVAPQGGPVGPILSGMAIAFFAYAGFENLTFIAGEFRNPRRDFPLAMSLAFVAYGLLTVALTATVAGLIAQHQVRQISGLYQVSQQLHPAWLASGGIVALALILAQLNATSWLWGMSRLVYTSARVGRLPRGFARLNERGLPSRAIITLGSVFVIGTVIAALTPGLLVGALTMTSSVFLFLYLLCVIAYLRVERSPLKRLGAALFLCVLGAVLVSVGARALYPSGIFVLALLVSLWRDRQRPRR